MRLGLVSLFPEMFAALNHGILRRAQEKSLLEFHFWNPRTYTTDIHHSVDDTPYGGGPGMVMQIEPILAAITAAKESLPAAKVIYLSPQGNLFNHQQAKAFSQEREIIFLCGRYEGIDERLISLCVDEQWSIGDYVLSGGELAAMVIIDCVGRLLPGALGNEASAEQDSFANHLLDYPHYTRPADFHGLSVPEVLLSGDHAKIRTWRLTQSLQRTATHRPDLLNNRILSTEEQELLGQKE
jgi:tRNA (guanine37-N1)-methyltransferase